MIIGLTDRPILRRDGKIRSGYKEEGSNKLVNTDYFLLHDAPGLAETLGETPKEIYFTVHSDRITDFMKADLRWYNASQLLCMSMHNSPDERGQSMGSVAAYFGVGSDVPYLQQRQFPGMQKARVRTCNYKSCPDFAQGRCSEHMFLDVIVPQFSMGAVFTLDNTSINAIMNSHSTFTKAWTRYGGKMTGQIFRMYKKPGNISYQKKDGSTGTREAPIVFIDMVNFEEYESKFRDKIRPEDWEALMNFRNRQTPITPQLSGNVAVAELAPPDEAGEVQQLTSTQAAVAMTDEDPVKARANDPAILPLFAEYGKLIGREATEQIRIATMKNIPSVADGITYLKNKIKEELKKQKTKAPAAAKETQQAPPAQQQQNAAPNQPGGLF